MHLLFTPNHVQLLNSCYPPTSALLTAGPDYSPKSHELSRLIYHASNHPGKLTKLGAEVEKRIRAECKKAKSGNIRARASLLISLAIFRSLATECRRDIALLSASLIASIDVTLAALPKDLEVIARAATVFTSWTTYTNGHLIGTDHNLTQDYMSALQQFSALSCHEASDQEVQNRTRLIGFAAITGALNSEALYNDSGKFRTQVATLLRPILLSLFQTNLNTLDEQSSSVKDTPGSPYIAEFRTRPPLERRAASIHIHVDGERGPSSNDVSDSALRALFFLLSHAGGAQLGSIMQSSFDNLDSINGWIHLEHCCWYARKTAEWAQYQYRYVVPTWLVERLLEHQDAPTISPLHTALAAMVATVFRSPTPLINLSSSDLMSNLLSLLLRRTSISANDPLLSPTVNCIASLGCHVYYSDQIQDLAAEIMNRIVMLEIQGVCDNDDPGFQKNRSVAICHLLSGLQGLIRGANEQEAAIPSESACEMKLSPSQRASSPSGETRKTDKPSELVPRRAKVSPEIWQDTLSLICDNAGEVRTKYAQVLVYYLAEEMPKYGENLEGDVAKRVRRLTEGPGLQATNVQLFLNAGDAGGKLLNALHAYIYILATSLTASAGRNTQSPRHSSTSNVGDTNSQCSPVTGRRSLSLSQGPIARKTSLIRRLVGTHPSSLQSSVAGSAEDYSNISKVLGTVQEQLPIRGMLTAVPMLLRLDAVTALKDGYSELTVRLKEIIATVWGVIGRKWGSVKLVRLCEEALFNRSTGTEFSHADNWAGLDCTTALDMLTSCTNVQEALGMSKEELTRRLSLPWSPEMALRDFIDKSGNFDTSLRGDSISPLLKISPALMQIENISLQSLARSSRGLGVTDLREALEGRGGLSSGNLARPASISTLDHASSVHAAGGLSDVRLRLTRTRSRTRAAGSGRGDVRDVLTKLGIGKQSGNLLKASFPQIQKPSNR